MKLIVVLFALVLVASAQYPRSSHNRQLRKSLAQSYGGPRSYGVSRSGFPGIPGIPGLPGASPGGAKPSSSVLSSIAGALSSAATAVVPVVRNVISSFTEKLQGTPFGRIANLIMMLFDLISGTAQCVIQQIGGQ